MQWYYSHNGQRQGPVSEVDFERFVSEGVVRPDTLVWKQGMGNWQPYGEVAGGAPTPPIPVPLPNPVQPLQPGPGPGPSPVGPASGKLAYAGFWHRVAAHLIDFVVLYVVSLILFPLLGLSDAGMMAAMEAQDQERLLVEMAAYLSKAVWVSLALGISYTWFFLARFAATPGKLAVGLRVVRPDGSRIGNGQIIGRYFAEILCYITLFIGYLIAAFDDEKRALHDYVAGTRVVRKS